MDKQIKVKFKIGSLIDFEAEGNMEDVEKIRDEFMDAIFPSIVEVVKLEFTKKETSIYSTNTNESEI